MTGETEKKYPAMTNGKIGQYIRAVALASLFMLAMILMGPVQDTGDDAIMAWQLSRGMGSLASFISPYLSLIMNWLYQTVPQLPWWSLLHVLGAWVLLIVICGGIEQNCPWHYRPVAYPVLFAAVWLAVMRYVNFTRTAVAFSLAGIVLCLEYIYTNQEKKRGVTNGLRLLSGTVLYCIGLMIRFQAALMTLPFMAVIVLLRETELHKRGARISRTALCGTLIIVLVTVATFVAENQFWRAHPDWEAYRQFSAARSAIVDYVDQYPTWEQAEEQYTALGLKNENDLNMLFHKIFLGDPDIFSIDTLRAIGTLRGRSIGAWTELKQAVYTLLFLLKNGTILLWVMLWFAYLACEKEKRSCLTQFLLLCVSGAFLAYFLLAGRITLRVWEPLLLAALVLGVLTAGGEKVSGREEKAKSRRIKNIAFISVIILLAVSTGIAQSLLTMHIPDSSDDRDEPGRERTEYMQSTPDRIYLLTEGVIHSEPDPSPFGLWEAIPQDYLNNYFSLSNWEMNTPTNLNRLKAYGITNPTLALLERTDTYSEYSDDWTFMFLKSHYGECITCSFVDTYPDGGAIVQYTAPIAKEIYPARGQGNAQILKWEAGDRWENTTWYIEGCISPCDNIKSCNALYCNIEKTDGEGYTFRLAVRDDGGFNAFFYDVDAEWMKDVEEVSIVALCEDGTYCYVGEWNEIGGEL